jgi:hypothetical protein
MKYVPPMGGKRIARTQRKRSGPSHIIQSSLLVVLVGREED